MKARKSNMWEARSREQKSRSIDAHAPSPIPTALDRHPGPDLLFCPIPTIQIPTPTTVAYTPSADRDSVTSPNPIYHCPLPTAHCPFLNDPHTHNPQPTAHNPQPINKDSPSHQILHRRLNLGHVPLTMQSLSNHDSYLPIPLLLRLRNCLFSPFDRFFDV